MTKNFKRDAYINIVEISRLYKYIWWDDTLSHWFRPGDKIWCPVIVAIDQYSLIEQSLMFCIYVTNK